MTEWDEPQAVIGSYLHRYAYPDYYAPHVERTTASCKAARQADARGDQHRQRGRRRSRCLQLRGEYMYVAEGSGGFRVYDIASDRQQGLLASGSSPRRSRRSATTPHVDIDATRPAWRCRPTSRSPRRATRAS